MSIDRLRAHWGLSRTPFTKELATSMLFASAAHQEAVARVGWIITERALGVVCGEVGAGPTARTSSFAFRGKEQDIREIGTRLNVRMILEGSVRRAGSRLRVTAQLIRVDDQTHLWAQNYESNRRDILNLQSDIAQAIAQQINLQLLAPQSGTAKAP